MTKVEYEKRLFLSHKSIASLPHEYLTVIGTLRASSIGFIFSSIKGKLCRIDDILDVFARDAFFRFVRVSRAAIDDAFASLFLRPSVFGIFPLAIPPGFYRELCTESDLNETTLRGGKVINLIYVLLSLEYNPL